MKIGGLQKVTLIDYPGEVACTIFLFGCNFRCGFCHNPSLVIGDDGGVIGDGGEAMEGFSVEEVLDFLRERKGKLDAVCISGGEPLMSLDFDFVRKIKELDYKIKIDTNGSFPEKLKRLIDEGLIDAVAMDIKGSREKYSEVSGGGVDLGKIEESIKIVYDFGGGNISTQMNTDEHRFENRMSEFRTTVVGRLHSKEDVVEIGRWVNEVCEGKPKRFFLQGFKSKGDLIDESFSGEDDVSEEYLVELKDCVGEFFEEVGVRV